MKQTPEQLYIELMKKTLTFTLWPEPSIPVESSLHKRSRFSQRFFNITAKLLRPLNLQVVKIRDVSESQRIEGEIWPGYADTMVGMKRLNNLQECIETVLNEKIEGDFIETGVWRGGACILMKSVLQVYGDTDRTIFVADSFEGLPKPDVKKHPKDEGDNYYKYNYSAVCQEEVENNFRKYSLLDERVIFLKGWFKDTLPNAPIEKLSILRLDGDMYGSTMDGLENLYSKLSVGGFCIIDDYGLQGCKAAVEDFMKKYSINADIKKIDWTGAYWRKAENI